jgi:hypothetical protein
MHHWGELSAWREHRRELLREAQERQLEREARKAHEAFAHSKKRPAAVEVRWGLPEDEPKVAKLLELNGMPPWVAFEERFIVAEREGEVLAAARYRTEPKRLLLDLLVASPWAGERRLAVDLYAEAQRLALELEVSDIVTRTDRLHAAYPHEAGYHRWGGGWRMDLSRPFERCEHLSEGGWLRRITLAGAFLVPKRRSRKSGT